MSSAPTNLRGRPPRTTLLENRGRFVVALLVAFFAGALFLDLSPAALWPAQSGWELVARFLRRALHPAFDHEMPPPDGAPPLWSIALRGARNTLVFATAAIGIAIPVGLALGFFASETFARGLDSSRARNASGRKAFVVLLRGLIAVLRSVHELLWAVLFLAAFGLEPSSAVLAIAIPYCGVFAKVYGEILDEAPRESAMALHSLGAGFRQSLVFGLFPRALPDLCAFTLYRFECAVRSSAVMGFFGFETLGYYIKSSFDNVCFGEVWSFFYLLMALIVLIEAWSAALRLRWVY